MLKNNFKSSKSDELKKYYYYMKKIRLFELRLNNLVHGKEVARYTHLSIGRESVSASVGMLFCLGDAVTSTYRTHGLALALGMNIGKLIKEILGYSGENDLGQSGSMHITSKQLGMYDSNAIVGGGIPIATGLALFRKTANAGNVCWCFFGDGAVQTGVFHESINFAAKHKLPIIFICENNEIGITTQFKTVSSVDKVINYASVYKIKGLMVDVVHAEKVLDSMKKAATYARSNKGPVLLEVMIPQVYPHSSIDSFTMEDVDPSQDTVATFEDYLIELAVLDQKNIEIITEKIMEEINIEWITESERVNKKFIMPLQHKQGNATFRNAIQSSFKIWMENNPNVIMLGNAIERTEFYSYFGSERVVCTPIAENTVIGIAHGLSLDGMRVIVDLMFASFCYVAMDQLINQLAMSQFYREKSLVPNVIIRCLCGNGVALGAQHAQNPHGLFAHIPGFTIMYPSTPEDASALINSMNEIDGPILFFENIQLRSVQGVISKNAYELGRLSIKRIGAAVTIVAVGAMVHIALESAEKLSENGIEAEVLDLVTIVPLDKSTINESVKKTGRLLVIDEAWPYAGLASYIISQVAIDCFHSLHAAPNQVTLLNIGAPASVDLLNDYVPNVEKVFNSVMDMF